MTTSARYETPERRLVPLHDPVYRDFHQAAKNRFKTKPVNLRLPIRDLLLLKTQAIREGVPYQSLIRKLIHQYLSDQKTFSSNA